ncbi:hypothetical protein K469DRAFT_703820 [Zopfia rhizophila CBS 207.26]|uniref:ATPase synthesis protein 25 n=1 Tax=Zopfia rhizophila CBS 207.26 TaxID=1314779 RepID=A0A6A6E933_9PEZI|nr:hypothetical protein K469DRAFT_703820 [Zopfia rhizophila CBS 207.26]
MHLPKREMIPDLPPNPPPLLKGLLHYLSITLGLDDLLLLDLRHLDPPPALGSKLLMIIGTARSEKHLHVSADTFCRWLRKHHGLRANAAGLLGRQELKIKLRRKAKRMKLLANIGGQEPEGAIDDGIRTGWICCTAGRIPTHPDDTAVLGAEIENFVGFRNVSDGVNIVVQMFTEEKRAGIDLETLWGGVARTQDRENRKADEKLGLKEAEEEPERTHLPGLGKSTDNSIPQTQKTVTVRRPNGQYPDDPKPRLIRQWSRPQSTGDLSSLSSTRDGGRQIRRLHTVGPQPLYGAGFGKTWANTSAINDQQQLMCDFVITVMLRTEGMGYTKASDLVLTGRVKNGSNSTSTNPKRLLFSRDPQQHKRFKIRIKIRPNDQDRTMPLLHPV